VAAIAFGQRAVVVDANVERVVARLFAIDSLCPPPAAIRAATDAITPDARSGDFAQAMMDLGAAFARARAQMPDVPAGDRLRAGRARPSPSSRPKAQAAPRGRLLDRARGRRLAGAPPGQGMLGGMRALPEDGWTRGSMAMAARLCRGAWRRWARWRMYSHIALDLAVMAGAAASLLGEGEWWPLARLMRRACPRCCPRRRAMAVGRE
jgi:A/G-specific adenine glycosylase